MTYNIDTPKGWGERKEKEMGNVRNRYGKAVNFEAAMNIADNEIIEVLHAEGSADTEQDFYTAYSLAHFKKYREEFEPDK